MDKIDLDAIMSREAKTFSGGAFRAHEGVTLFTLNCMKEAIHQALILASETSYATVNGWGDACVNKQSILNVEKLVV